MSSPGPGDAHVPSPNMQAPNMRAAKHRRSLKDQAIAEVIQKFNPNHGEDGKFSSGSGGSSGDSDAEAREKERLADVERHKASIASQKAGLRRLRSAHTKNAKAIKPGESYKVGQDTIKVSHVKGTKVYGTINGRPTWVAAGNVSV